MNRPVPASGPPEDSRLAELVRRTLETNARKLDRILAHAP